MNSIPPPFGFAQPGGFSQEGSWPQDRPMGGPAGDALSLREVLATLRRIAPAAVLAGGIAALGTAAHVSQLPRSYTAVSQVLHEPGASQLLAQDAFRRETGGEAARVESQLHVLRSDRIARAVIAALNLTEDPDFRPGEDGPRLGPSAAMSWLRAAIGRDGASAPRPGAEREAGDDPALRYAIEAFGNRLAVRRVGQSHVIEIAVRASSPERAAEIANATATAYVAEDVRAKAEAARRASGWLEERIEDLRSRSLNALRASERFRASGGAGLLSDARVQAAELESVSQASRRVYEAFLERLSEMSQLVSLPMADARVVSLAQVPMTHSEPRITLAALFAGLVGAGIGAIGALARSALDRRLRSRAQVEALGLRFLGTIRRAGTRPGRLRALLARGRGRPAGGWRPGEMEEAVLNDLRRVRVTLHHSLSGIRPVSIGFAPVGATDGSGLPTARLAWLSSVAGDRTLLVDACPDGWGASRSFVPANGAGLMELLEDPSRLGALVTRVAESGLFVLPPGRPVRGISAGDRIGRSTVPLLKAFKEGFDTVLVDLPPPSRFPDARAMGPLLDGVVLVARHGAADLDEIAEVAADLQSTGTVVLGLVLDGLPARARFE